MLSITVKLRIIYILHYRSYRDRIDHDIDTECKSSTEYSRTQRGEV